MSVRGKIVDGKVYPISSTLSVYDSFERETSGEVRWVGGVNYDNFKLAERWLLDQGYSVKLHRVGRRVFPPQFPQ